jgi:REP element-mobilizing transposase RayT
MQLHKRKNIRLKEFDYSSRGAYFITICTQNREQILCDIVGANIVRPQKYGEIVKSAIESIPEYYPAVSVDKYVIMPNHVHLLLQIHSEVNGRTLFAPTVDRVIKQTKGVVTKQIGFSIWQKSFYDHVIRDESDYIKICNYIDENPQKWKEDKYYK